MRTPGPGSYDVPQHLTMSFRGNAESPTASFMSASQRSQRQAAATGDPGAYDPAGPKAALSARARESFNRTSTSGTGSFSSRLPRE